MKPKPSRKVGLGRVKRFGDRQPQFTASRGRSQEWQGRTTLESRACVYCGERATTRDHFPPYSSDVKAGGFSLPACSECNRFAGDVWPTNFEKRAAHVKGKIRKKYARILATPDWTAEELSELSGNLREKMAIFPSVKQSIERRLDWDAMTSLRALCARQGIRFL